MKRLISLVGVALALCSAAPLAAQTPATWEAPVKVASTDGALTKSAGCEGCPDSGAHTVTQLNGEGAADFVPAFGHRIIAGLGTDLSASTDASAIDYAFSLWPGGTWEIRERGVYRSEGAFVAGDSFRVAVEVGRVVYRRNGTLVYTSAVQPSYPLAFDVTLYSTRRVHHRRDGRRRGAAGSAAAAATAAAADIGSRRDGRWPVRRRRRSPAVRETHGPRDGAAPAPR